MHLKLLNQYNRLDLALKTFCYGIITIPKVAICACVHFFAPLVNEKIPFIKKSESKWVFHIYPDAYIIVIRWLYTAYNMHIFQEVIKEGKHPFPEFIGTFKHLEKV